MRLAVLGSDRRLGEAAAWLSVGGHRVAAWGCPLPPGAAGLAVAGPQAALADAEAVLLSPTGPGEAEIAVLGERRPDVPLLTGRLPQASGPTAGRLAGLRWLNYGASPAFQAANAVPTAEAAIAQATHLAGRTAAGSACLVLGYGFCGSAIAQRLVALGAEVTVVAREADDRRQALVAGCMRAAPWGEAEAAAAGADICWNTVPAPVLGRSLLAALAPRAVVLDIASAPGGTDFPAAEQLGVRAVLAPGLPGRDFPRTAGEIVGRVALRILAQLGG